MDGNTPLDVAAKEHWAEGFDILLSHTVSSRRDDQAKKSLKKAMDGQRTRDDFVAEQLEEMSPFRCAGMIAICPQDESLMFTVGTCPAVSLICSSQRGVVARETTSFFHVLHLTVS